MVGKSHTTEFISQPEAFCVFCFLKVSFYLLLMMCVYHVYVGVCGGQRTAFGSWFSPSFVVPGQSNSVRPEQQVLLPAAPV